MMGASRAALLGGWLHVCWAATRLSELAPSPEDAAPNSIALPARMDVLMIDIVEAAIDKY